MCDRSLMPAAASRLAIPKPSAAAETAALLIGSPCVVILSINGKTGKFETRCYGANDIYLWMAAQLSDVTIEAAAASEPPAGWEQAVLTLGKPEGGKQ